jgi:hypothetical protein
MRHDRRIRLIAEHGPLEAAAILRSLADELEELCREWAVERSIGCGCLTGTAPDGWLAAPMPACVR